MASTSLGSRRALLPGGAEEGTPTSRVSESVSCTPRGHTRTLAMASTAVRGTGPEAGPALDAVRH